MNLAKLEQKALSSKKHHYQLLPDVGVAIVDANLSPTGYRVWIYLCCIFPFSGVTEMPTQEELAMRLGVNIRTLRRALNEIEEAGLWRFKVDKWRSENLTGYGRNVADKSLPDVNKKLPEIDKNLPEMDKIVRLPSPEPLQDAPSSIPLDLNNINLDLDQKERELTHARAREEKKPEPELVRVEPLRAQDAEIPSVPLPKIGEGEFSAPPLSQENFESFDFARFRPESESEFWVWACQRVEGLKRLRDASNHPEPIGDVPAYALACIKKRGAGGYRAYLIEVGKLPDEMKQAAAASVPTAQLKSAPPGWQQSHSNLKLIFERNGIEGVISTLKLMLGGSNAPPDPDKVRWLIDQNPQWRLKLENGRIESIDKVDVSDHNAQIQIFIRQLGLTKEALEPVLVERYGQASRARLTDEQICDLAEFLKSWAIGGGNGAANNAA